MSSDTPDVDSADEPFVSGEDAQALARAIESNEAELAELLDVLVTAQALAEDLAPEVRATVREHREPIGELRVAFEREETLALFRAVGENADTLVELLDVLETTQSLVDDLLPELKVVVRENRETLGRLRMAFEHQETLRLVERLGENADTLGELLLLLDASYDLASELVPEAVDLTRENRDAIAQLRMAAAGFADAQRERQGEVDMYEFGRNAANVVALTQTLGDPQVAGALEASLSAFAADEDDVEPVGLFGLLGALRDREVRVALGRLVEAARRLAAATGD